eukprot:15172223-Alexandrium_andersonii.AAC.1
MTFHWSPGYAPLPLHLLSSERGHAAAPGRSRNGWSTSYLAMQPVASAAGVLKASLRDSSRGWSSLTP